MRNQLSKTNRQQKEYNKLIGFNMIKSKYDNCKDRIDKIILKV